MVEIVWQPIATRNFGFIMCTRAASSWCHHWFVPIDLGDLAMSINALCNYRILGWSYVTRLSADEKSKTGNILWYFRSYLVTHTHVKLWCWLCGTNRPLSSTKNDINYLNHFNAEKCLLRTESLSRFDRHELVCFQMVPSTPDGPHVGAMNLAIGGFYPIASLAALCSPTRQHM